MESEWAKEFTVPLEWVERGVAACDAAGVDSVYFRNRYLLQDGTEFDATVDAKFRELFLTKRCRA